jgi:hypothetical protein
MNTRSFKQILFYALVGFILGACQKEIQVNYQLNSFDIQETKSLKNKAKNEAEYISILYTNLFQTAISPSTLFQAQNVMYSIGDQSMAKELLLSNYFNAPKILIPSNEDMRSDMETFIRNTYKRFYLRNPSQSELYFFRNYIQNNPDVTVEMVYTSFASSDEYGFY